MAINLKPLDQQVIAITGASSGIGLATAYAASSQGAKLVLAARSEEALSRIVDDLVNDGCDAVYVVADVAVREQVQRIADTAIRCYGRIDTWVNDAGVSIYGRLDQVSEEDNRRLFDTNFWGVVNGSLVALPYLLKQGGALINLGSEVSEAVVPLQGMYAASKHAIKGFTDALRVEIQEMDKAPVSITLIQPTAVDTPYPQHARNYMDKEPKLPISPIDPLKVAEAILHAATNPERDVKVGMMSKINTNLSNILPALAEKMATRYAGKQQYDEPPRHPEGTLYKPGGEAHIRGSGGAMPH